VPPRANPGPSDKQLETLRYLITFIEDHGYQPTQSEMAIHFDVTKNAIQNRLRELAKRGLVDMPAGEKTRERALVIKHVKFRAYYAGSEGEE
jgi:DNA-binding MarR family transcriptional regulator